MNPSHASIRSAAGLLAALSITLLAGCDGRSPSSTATAQPKRNVNVVIFLIDTLRADHVSAYGYGKPTSPTLDALARDGVRFSHAQAPAPWTCPSVPSLMTSTFLCEHRITSELKTLSPDIKTMAERFKQIDYHTASFYVNIFAGPTTGMDRGFEICRENPNGRFYIDGGVIDQWAAEKPDGPFFLYVHNIEPHNPFNAPDRLTLMFGDSTTVRARIAIGQLISRYRPMLRPDWVGSRGLVRPLGTTNYEPQLSRIVAQLNRLRPHYYALYDAVVRQADERVASVIGSLKQMGVWDDTLFIVLSDHGEEIGERGDFLHSQSVYAELTNVPLIIKFPKNQYAGRVVDDVVTLVDVLPTIFDYLGRPEQIGATRGRSLMPLIRGEHSPAAEPFRLTTVRMNEKKYRKRWGELRGNINIAVETRDGRWKGIWNVEKDTFELYDHASDPTERFNLCESQPELAETMYHFARDAYETCNSDSPGSGHHGLTPEELDRLKSLGYAGGFDEIHEDESPELPVATRPAATQHTPHAPCPVPAD